MNLNVSIFLSLKNKIKNTGYENFNFTEQCSFKFII